MLKGVNVRQEERIYSSIKYICSRAGISSLIQIVCFNRSISENNLWYVSLIT